ncbi:MAG: InlB B-repeat-containing protein [Candidatus Coproplasma sp.]
MKRLFTVLICSIVLCCLAGCSLEVQNKKVTDENFYCKVIDDNNVAIGDVKTYPQSGAVFYPEQIENYTVSVIGFASGLGFGGNGYLDIIGENGIVIKRCYFPHTIKEVSTDGYMKLTTGHLKVFYCGDVVDLGNFGASQTEMEIYVPSEKYELFKNIISKYYYGSLLKANVSYHLNYDDDNYYYIDYYESGEKILYIPPIPQRDGYTFGGWFKETECINQWDFDTDTLMISEETPEIKLFAKWIVG